MAGDEKKTQTSDPFQPIDLGRMLEQMQMPGVDMTQLAEDARKNIEALQAANQAVAAGWQALAEKQMEIFQQTMQRWQESVSSGTSPASPEKQAALAREGFEQALENMRELAEIATTSQSKAFDIVRTRFEENLRNLFPGSAKKDG